MEDRINVLVLSSESETIPPKRLVLEVQKLISRCPKINHTLKVGVGDLMHDVQSVSIRSS